ncbi:zinc finger homeobox protein 4-like isoform X2 [Tachysurus vachellii]|uniref:zinc finger homeobox protein 4-like isoform X2 n=1 Tax=Tachysurus vachellii TaxID=175792 RepID=UPI00296AA0A3|nr:zinc finger homeobox protein 4-like isoform X2 [Tachysurus vachellii]
MTDCMCRGCYSGSGASLHYIPKDPETRQKWIEFIYKNRTAPKFKNLDRIRICSAHFTEECFTNYRQKMMGFGKRLILKPNAVPTIAVHVEFTSQSRTRQEKQEETTAETRLCPLCQRRQKDSEALSFHLTKRHSVHPACLNNLLITAPYVNRSSEAQDSSIQNINDTSQKKSSESTESSLMPVQQDGSSQDNDTHDESGEGIRGSIYGDSEDSVKEEKYNAKNNANQLFKCHACLEFFTHKSALSVHYNSATHIQKIRTGAGNDRDSSTPLLAYPYTSTKPYQCDVCHVSYFYAFGLESHLKSVLHQSRTRKAGNTAANSKTNTETGIMVGNVACTTAANPRQLASAKTCNYVTQGQKVQLQPASSLLPAPVVSAQAVPTVLPLLTLAPNSVPHNIVPSVFPPPRTSSTQLIPQTQMLMPMIVNGLQAQSATRDSSQHIVQQAVPVLGICSAQQVQELSTSDSQSQSAATGVSSASGIPLETNMGVNGEGVTVKFEIKEEPCDQVVSQMTPCTEHSIRQVGLKEEHNSIWDRIVDNIECGDNQPGKSNSSNANIASKPLSTKPCSSSGLETPALTEFQSQVLWAFSESRNGADFQIPPREDCDALGREVGLTEDEVRKWLTDMHRTKDGHRADVQTHYDRQGSTEDDEDALTIDESGGTVLRSNTDFLSEIEDADDEQTTADKKRKRGMD